MSRYKRWRGACTYNAVGACTRALVFLLFLWPWTQPPSPSLRIGRPAKVSSMQVYKSFYEQLPWIGKYPCLSLLLGLLSEPRKKHICSTEGTHVEDRMSIMAFWVSSQQGPDLSVSLSQPQRKWHNCECASSVPLQESVLPWVRTTGFSIKWTELMERWERRTEWCTCLGKSEIIFPSYQPEGLDTIWTPK